MSKITQISAAALVAMFASSAFVATAEAAPKRVHCKETVFLIFKTACEEPRRRKLLKRELPGAQVNFRPRTPRELSVSEPNGGNSDGGGRK